MTKLKDKPKDKKVAEPKTTSSKKPSAPQKSTRTKEGKNDIGDQQRYEMIQTAAYFIAERSGFNGDLHECWVEAEKQIDKMLSK